MLLIDVLWICAHRVEVYECRAVELAARSGLENLRGYFDSDSQQIYIEESQGADRKRDSKLHEVGHAFLMYSGLGEYMKASLNEVHDYDDWEEQFIALSIPNFVQLIATNGGALWTA